MWDTHFARDSMLGGLKEKSLSYDKVDIADVCILTVIRKISAWHSSLNLPNWTSKRNKHHKQR
jgi:hypothetical protein